MAYRTSPPKTPPPIKRLDSVNAKRLDGEAKGFLAAPPGTRLDANDRRLMIEAIEARPNVVSIAERSDDYIAARFVAMRGDDVPADGMAPGSIVAAEVKGSAKQMRTRQNAYLNTARNQLVAESNGKMVNANEVEDRAYQLSKTDPLGLFQ